VGTAVFGDSLEALLAIRFPFCEVGSLPVWRAQVPGDCGTVRPVRVPNSAERPDTSPSSAIAARPSPRFASPAVKIGPAAVWMAQTPGDIGTACVAASDVVRVVSSETFSTRTIQPVSDVGVSVTLMTSETTGRLLKSSAARRTVSSESAAPVLAAA